MNRSRIFALLIIVVFLLAGGGYFWQRQRQQPPTKVSYYKLAPNLQFANFSGSQISFFTGSAFASYNLATQKSARLSDYLYITSPLSNVSWFKNSVVFFAGPTSTQDQLSIAATRLGAGTTSGHWWRYDFAAKQLQLVGFKDADNCLSLNEVSAGLVCVSPHLGSVRVFDVSLYSLSSGSLSAVLQTTDAASQVQAFNDNLYLVTTDLAGGQTIQKINLAAKTSQTVYSGKDTEKISSYSVDSAGNTLVSQIPSATSVPVSDRTHNDTTPSTSDVKQKLELIASSGKSLSAKNLNAPLGQTLLLGPQLEFMAPNGLAYKGADNRLVKDDLGYAQSLSAGGVYSNQKYFVDSANDLYSLVNQPAAYKSAGGFNIAQNDDSSGFYISPASDEKFDVFVYNTRQNFTSNAIGVSNFLVGLGYDPDQFSFVWQLNGDEGSVPINEQASLLK